MPRHAAAGGAAAESKKESRDRETIETSLSSHRPRDHDDEKKVTARKKGRRGENELHQQGGVLA